jgi:sulfur carrier protein
MKLNVKLFTGEVSSKNVDMPDDSTYFDLLSLLNINPETVVIFNSGVSVAFDATVEGHKVEIMRVVSGG